jgi:2-C-methyl-D-erythritol 4-phosphate cytidylyltransferase
MGPGDPKALRVLGGVPILVHALRALRDVGVIVVAAPADGVAGVEALLAEYGVDYASLSVVAGGATRRESVANALRSLPPDVDTVLVHDAARALTPVEVVERVAAAVRGGEQAVIPALPVVDTIKSVEAYEGDAARVTATVDRSRLRAVQTPQGFRRDVLDKAHAEASGDVTDDAGMVEVLGIPVTVVPGHPEAFKITTPFDLVLAEAVLARREATSA